MRLKLFQGSQTGSWESVEVLLSNKRISSGYLGQYASWGSYGTKGPKPVHENQIGSGYQYALYSNWSFWYDLDKPITAKSLC